MSQDNNFDIADFLQRFSTKVLWHFTGYNKADIESFQILKNILSTKILQISQKSDGVIMPSGQVRGGFPVACVCDIPFKDLKIHTLRYGQYGIAFKKESAIRRGHFNPVFYVQHDHHLFKHAEKLLDIFDNEDTNNQEMNKALHEYLMLVGTYAKRSDLTRKISIGEVALDKEQNNNFYYEREWRTAYPWNFQKEDVAAILLPQVHLEEMKEFINLNNEIKSFNSIPLISHEMVDLL